MVKQIGSDAGGQNFFQVKVSEAFVSKVATKGSGESGEITQDVTFTFKEMKVCYRKRKNDGQLAGAISFNWSVKKNDEAIAITGSI
jgi:type VI protein secretion system component Hcp